MVFQHFIKKLLGHHDTILSYNQHNTCCLSTYSRFLSFDHIVFVIENIVLTIVQFPGTQKTTLQNYKTIERLDFFIYFKKCVSLIRYRNVFFNTCVQLTIVDFVRVHWSSTQISPIFIHVISSLYRLSCISFYSSVIHSDIYLNLSALIMFACIWFCLLTYSNLVSGYNFIKIVSYLKKLVLINISWVYWHFQLL